MRKLWKRTRAFVADNWQVGLGLLAVLSVVGFILTYQLQTLVGGMSAGEAAIYQQLATNAITPQTLLRNPLDLPYFVAAYAVQLSPFLSIFALRSIGVLFGFLGAIGFFYILKKWYSVRIAVLGTALFVTSSWFLHTARFADPAAAYLLIPLLLAGIVALQSKDRAPWVLLLVVLLGFSMLYVPGLIWFIAPAVVLQRRLIIKSLGLQPIWFRVVLGLMAVFMLAPLGAALVWPLAGMSGFHNALALVGLPNDFSTLLSFFKTAARTVSDIFIYSRAGPLYAPGHLPWLDVCTSILVIMGIVQFARHFRLDRTKLLAIVGVVGLVLIATGGPVSAALLLPFVFLLAVEGLKWLLDMWLSVFPRNPVARGFGVTMAVALVCIVGTYQLQKYFLAWGHAPETHAVFNKQM